MNIEDRKVKKTCGFKLPISEVQRIIFLSPSSSGFVLGVTHSNRHIQLINDGSSISSHTTVQNQKKKWDHIGRISKSDIDERFLFDLLKPKKLLDDELDKKVFYFTKRWDCFFNAPENKFFKKEETKNEIISYLDLDEIFKHTSLFVQQLGSSPETLCGLYTAKEILSSKEIEFGLLEDNRAIIKIENELYGIELSLIQDASHLSNTLSIDSPLSKVLKSLGLMSLNEDLSNRLNEIFAQTNMTVS
jgi:hypothetical protein